MNIILHSDDINLLDYWEKSLKESYNICFELDELKKLKSSIVIINYSAFNSQQKEFIQILNDSLNKVLVLHRVPDIVVAREVLSYGAKGYGNALMKDHFLHAAINTLKEDMIWLYPELTSKIIINLPTTEVENNISDILSVLSKREKEVAYLLRDGATYKEISAKLDITPRTVKAHAQHIYQKLNLKDRLALAIKLK